MLRTERLLLRRWLARDRQPFARMNADRVVMAFLVAPLNREESDAFVERIETDFAVHGFGLWAVEELSTGQFIGYTGLLHQTFEAPFTPAVEIGYRLAHNVWGRGYATEAAAEALRYGFEEACLSEIVSMTAVGNIRSQGVMNKLGMTHDPADDFDHPKVPDGHPVKRHVLYRLSAQQWRVGRARSTS